MILELVALLCTGLFAGAAIYVSGVEHPARVSCGIEAAIREAQSVGDLLRAPGHRPAPVLASPVTTTDPTYAWTREMRSV